MQAHSDLNGVFYSKDLHTIMKQQSVDVMYLVLVLATVCTYIKCYDLLYAWFNCYFIIVWLAWLWLAWL